MDKILISACLLGKPVRYDGAGKLLDHMLIEIWRSEGRLVAVCPEILAGFDTPRPPAEIADGANGGNVLDGQARIVENTGRDVTKLFRDGADITLQTARDNYCRFALLTDGSPSCGSSYLYDGSFNSRKITGKGVTAALLVRNGIEVFSEHQITELAAKLR